MDKGARKDAQHDRRSEILADRHLDVTLIQTEAKAAGMAWRTIERAKARLGVVSDVLTPGSLLLNRDQRCGSRIGIDRTCLI
jgi:hypothetical protein